MSAEVADPRTALRPLQAALLANARREAARLRAAATDEGGRAVAAAQAEADAVTSAARARGRAEAAAAGELRRARDRRAAREQILHAQREAVDELREQAQVAVRALLDRPGERARLTRVVRAMLGPTAVVRESPDGGVLGHAPDGRRVDASVCALTDGVLADLDLEQLWSLG